MRILLAILATGLHGTVTRGPTQPVCILGKPCDAPAAGVVLIFSRAGRDVASVRTDLRGGYTVTLAPGRYAVRLSARPKVGSGLQPRLATVPSGTRARLDFSIDTGIR